MTTERLAALRLRAWAECVQRLIAVAPTAAVARETGIVATGHSTPPERKAIRAQAAAMVESWLARDLAALVATPPDAGTCDLAPDGWFCSLDAGHVGACALWPIDATLAPTPPDALDVRGGYLPLGTFSTDPPPLGEVLPIKVRPAVDMAATPPDGGCWKCGTPNGDQIRWLLNDLGHKGSGCAPTPPDALRWGWRLVR